MQATKKQARKPSAVTPLLAAVQQAQAVTAQAATPKAARGNLPVAVKLGKPYGTGGSAAHQARQALMAKLVGPTQAMVAGGVPASHIAYALKRGFLLPA
jgi:hypothetical protein